MALKSHYDLFERKIMTCGSSFSANKGATNAFGYELFVPERIGSPLAKASDHLRPNNGQVWL